MQVSNEDRPAASTFPSWPVFAEDEVAAVERVLRSGKVNYWTGDRGVTFEVEYAKKFGLKHAVALANGSVALESCFQALGLQPGDEVIVTPRTFLASTSCAIIRGLTPVFVDVDRESGNITAETIAPAITSRTRAIVPVHIGGWPCEMAPIMDLAKSHGLFVVEDCAQSHGATIDGRYAGTYGQINSWSFCQDKIITTGGEGGMVTTDDDELWNRAWSYKDHGKSYDAVFLRKHAPGFRWLHESFGTNWRLTESQSAIGLIQLSKLDSWVARRRRSAAILRDRLSSLSGLRVPWPREGISAVFYRFYAFLEPGVLRDGVSREQLISEVTALGVPLFSGSCSEIYLEAAFEGTGFRPSARLPVAKELGETSLAFLTHPTMEDEDIHRVADGFEKVFKANRR